MSDIDKSITYNYKDYTMSEFTELTNLMIETLERYLAEHFPYTLILAIVWIAIGWPLYVINFIQRVFDNNT